jgi:hypothetical protein
MSRLLCFVSKVTPFYYHSFTTIKIGRRTNKMRRSMRSTVKLEGDVIQVDNDSSVEAKEIACGDTFATKRKVDANKIVEKEGYSYFVVDKDYAKGDRRCDGKFMADCFSVVETGECITSVLRQSQRVQQKRSLAETLLHEGEG